MIILGVDPGKVTGWAFYDVRLHRLGGAWEAPGAQFLDWIVPWLQVIQPEDELTVACERFVIAGGTVEMGRTDENWSIEQIGILRHHSRWAGHRFELQGAGDAKNFAPNKRLKELGWYVPGKGHANDGLRHVLLNIGRHHVAELDHLLTMKSG